MRKLPLVLNLICLPVFADVSAYLDRHTITVQDSVRLTLEADTRVDKEPDFSPLYHDFQFLGSKQLTLSSHAGGGSQYRTRWELLLRPKQAGELTVPAIQVGPASSRILPLRVLSAEARHSGLQDEQVFIEAAIDRPEVYLGGQLLYTVRLYHALKLAPGAQLNAPYLPGGLVKPLGDQSHYSRQVNGRLYDVIEQRYALFPGQTGELTLDGSIFEAHAIQDGSQIELQASPQTVSVLAPAYQSARGYWLPAAKLTLEDDWQPPKSVRAGEAVAQTLTLTAIGLPASRLPALAPAGNAELEIRTDSVELREDVTDNGLVSTRIEHLSLIPARSGTLQTPPVDLTWWDVGAGRARNASLSGHALKVAAAPVPTSNAPTPAAAGPSRLETDLQQALNSNRLLIGLLTFISLVSSLGWLYTHHQLRLIRKESRDQAEAEEKRRRHKLLMAHQMAEKNTFQALVMACQQNNANVAKLRLIEWAQNFWPDHQIFSSEDISDAARSQTLDFLILDLEQHLYQDDPKLWQGDLLLEAVEKLRQRRPPGYEETPLAELNYAS